MKIFLTLIAIFLVLFISTTTSFAQVQRTLSINKLGNGTGTVMSSPAGIDCDVSCNTQSNSFNLNESVLLNQQPTLGTNFIFGGWGGDCAAAGLSQTTFVIMSQNRSCTASFVIPVNECTNGVNNCDMNATCIDTPLDFTCECDPGFTGDGTTDGTGCTEITNPICDSRSEEGQCDDDVDNDGDGLIDFADTMDCDSCLDDNECLVFITSTLHDGNLGGLHGADAICQQRAIAGGLDGEFRAWISNDTDSPESRFNQADVPYVLPNNGPQIAGSWTELTDFCDNQVPPNQCIDNPIMTNEFGVSLTNTEETAVWTNTNRFGDTTGGSGCDNWSNINIVTFFGRADETGVGWTDSATLGCDNELRLYCFQQ